MEIRYSLQYRPGNCRIKGHLCICPVHRTVLAWVSIGRGVKLNFCCWEHYRQAQRLSQREPLEF